jgi:hypothetical protein
MWAAPHRRAIRRPSLRLYAPETVQLGEASMTHVLMIGFIATFIALTAVFAIWIDRLGSP